MIDGGGGQGREAQAPEADQDQDQEQRGAHFATLAQLIHDQAVLTASMDVPGCLESVETWTSFTRIV